MLNLPDPLCKVPTGGNLLEPSGIGRPHEMTIG
jgi:hypothetical protein